MKPILIVLALATTLFASTGPCPDSITVDQKLSASVAGFEPMADPAPIRLSGITFFDGPPEEQASLVYDKIVRMSGKDLATWTFAPQSKTWLACRYSSTSIMLKQPLPPKTTTCSVTYNPNEQIAGNPVIEKIVCK